MKKKILWVSLHTEGFLMLNGYKIYPAVLGLQICPTAYRKSFKFPVKLITCISPLTPPTLWFAAKTLANPSAEAWREIFASPGILMQPKLCCGWEEADSKNTCYTEHFLACPFPNKGTSKVACKYKIGWWPLNKDKKHYIGLWTGAISAWYICGWRSHAVTSWLKLWSNSMYKWYNV